MVGILYVPFIDTDLGENSFNYSNDNLDYLSELQNAQQNIVGGENYFNSVPDEKTIGFNPFMYKDQNNNIDYSLSFCEVPCRFLDISEKDEDINNLLGYAQNNEPFISIFQINEDEVDEESAIELKGWITESKKVMDLPVNQYSEDIKLQLQPSRDFKIKVDEYEADLINCKLADFYDGKIAVFTEIIKFKN